MGKKKSFEDNARSSLTSDRGGEGNGRSSLTSDGRRSLEKNGKSSLTSDGRRSLDKKVSFSRDSIGSDGRKSLTKTGSKKSSKGRKSSDRESESNASDTSDSDDGSDPSTPRSSNADSDTSKDDDDDDDDDADDEESEIRRAKKKKKMKISIIAPITKFVRRTQKHVVKAFVNYGPPYKPQPEYVNIDLMNECAKPAADPMKINKLLNKKIDPNFADPTDLYYRPIHWAARNLHLRIVKMLKRAGADMNVTNEMGCTPLDFVVMLKQTPDMRKKQLQTVTYFLENGVDVNTRDKGGMSPIDHAAFNQDKEVIELLLKFGARVVRNNKMLVAQRQPILEVIYKPECYKLIYERLILEQQEIAKREEEQKAVLGEEKRAKSVDKLFDMLDKKKERRARIRRERERAEKIKKIEDDRLAQILEEENRAYEAKMAKLRANGIWMKESDGRWDLKNKTSEMIKKTSVDIYSESSNMISSLQKSYSKQNYSSKWAELTGGGTLEMPWRKSEPFGNMQDSLDIMNESVSGQSNTQTLASNDINYKTEDDKELESIKDLDSIIDLL